MEIGKTLDLFDRRVWRSWLAKHHSNEKEIWLIYYRKQAGKPRIPYNDAVEEALCYGWIDSTVKKIDDDRYAQRFTPRRDGSQLSETNRHRALALIKAGRMTQAGLKKTKTQLDTKIIVPKDILAALKKDKTTWNNFQKFPAHYQRIRIAFVEGARSRPDMFKQRLQYFLKMTRQNKKFGMVK